MKKFFLALATFAGLSLNAFAQAEPGNDNGFGLKLQVGIAGGSFSKEIAGQKVEMDHSGIGYGLELDNRWYVWHNDKMGAAINARWLDFEYTPGTTSYKGLEEDVNSVEAGILGVGPMFTYYLGNNMAVDAYYNIVPSVSAAIGDDVTYLGFGLAHHAGAAFRYKVFQAGCEYRFGKFEVADVDDDDFTMDAPLNNLRIFLGFKF